VIKHRASFSGDKVSVISHEGSVITLNCTPIQYMLGIQSYNQGEKIQDAFPFLSADEREFLISGTTKEQWDAMFYSGVEE
jgi:hypothetical protein